MSDVDTVLIFVIIGVVILAGAVAYGVNLVRGGAGRTVERGAPPAAPGLPTDDLDRRPPTDSTDTVAPPEKPGAPAPAPETVAPEAPAAPPAPPAPAIERPESARGRLQRLRARLARSNSSIGQGLLALLSRGRLDEETWEEVEDTLIGSDLGVEATTQLVDSLRTKVKVDGTTDEATVRGWLRDDLL